MEGESFEKAASLNSGKLSVSPLLGTSQNSDMQLSKQISRTRKHGMGNITGLICLSINALSVNLQGKSVNKNKIDIPNDMETINCKKVPIKHFLPKET